MAEITEILLFSGMPLLERSKTTVWERHLFKKKKKYYGRFEFVSTLRKNVFWGAAVKCVFLYGSNNSDFLFSGMPLLERSKITVGAESHRSHFLKII